MRIGQSTAMNLKPHNFSGTEFSTALAFGGASRNCTNCSVYYGKTFLPPICAIC